MLPVDNFDKHNEKHGQPNKFPSHNNINREGTQDQIYVKGETV